MAKYYPLIDCSDDGRVKVPLFFTDDKSTVRENHTAWLEEISNDNYVLSCREEPDRPFLIRCPKCGSTLIHSRYDIYFCTKCKYDN